MIETLKTCFAIGAVVACYGIYAFTNPGANGVVFASILAAVVGLASYAVGAKVSAVRTLKKV